MCGKIFIYLSSFNLVFNELFILFFSISTKRHQESCNPVESALPRHTIKKQNDYLSLVTCLHHIFPSPYNSDLQCFMERDKPGYDSHDDGEQ